MSTCTHIKRSGNVCGIECESTVIACPLVGELTVYNCKKHVKKAKEIITKETSLGKSYAKGTYDYFKQFCSCTTGWRKTGCQGYIGCQA